MCNYRKNSHPLVLWNTCSKQWNLIFNGSIRLTWAFPSDWKLEFDILFLICFSDCSNKLIAMTLAWRCLQFTAYIWKFAIKISTNSFFVLFEQQYGWSPDDSIHPRKNRSTTFFIWDVCILVVRENGPARKMEFWLILFLLITTTTTTMPLQHRLLLCPTDQPLLPLVIRDTLCISGRLVDGDISTFS